MGTTPSTIGFKFKIVIVVQNALSQPCGIFFCQLDHLRQIFLSFHTHSTTLHRM